MGVFKNEVGRPSNEVLRKRRIIKFGIVIFVFALVAVIISSIQMLTKTNYNIDTNKLKGAAKTYTVTYDMRGLPTREKVTTQTVTGDTFTVKKWNPSSRDYDGNSTITPYKLYGYTAESNGYYICANESTGKPNKYSKDCKYKYIFKPGEEVDMLYNGDYKLRAVWVKLVLDSFLEKNYMAAKFHFEMVGECHMFKGRCTVSKNKNPELTISSTALYASDKYGNVGEKFLTINTNQIAMVADAVSSAVPELEIVGIFAELSCGAKYCSIEGIVPSDKLDSYYILSAKLDDGSVINKWIITEDKAKVKYDANGGTFNSKKYKNYQLTETYIPGEKLDLYQDIFVRDGYAFTGYFAKRITDNRYYATVNGKEGWYTKEQIDSYVKNGTGSYVNFKSINKLMKPGEHVQMVAQWKKVQDNQFIVKFMASNGNATGTMADQYITYGKSTRLSKNNFSVQDYVFDGWIAQWNKDGRAYYRGCTSSFLSCTSSRAKWLDPDKTKIKKYYIYTNRAKVSKTVDMGHTVIMKAQWSSKYFTVKYDPNGGILNYDQSKLVNEIYFSQIIQYGQKIVYGKSTKLLVIKPTNGGRQFKGYIAQWKKDGKTYYRGCTNANRKCSNIMAKWLTKDRMKKPYYYQPGEKVSKTVDRGHTVTMIADWGK